MDSFASWRLDVSLLSRPPLLPPSFPAVAKLGKENPKHREQQDDPVLHRDIRIGRFTERLFPDGRPGDSEHRCGRPLGFLEFEAFFIAVKYLRAVGPNPGVRHFPCALSDSDPPVMWQFKKTKTRVFQKRQDKEATQE
jgi:hypothetical protein